MADRVDIARPIGRTWTVTADLLVSHFAAVVDPRSCPNEKAAAVGCRSGLAGIVQRGSTYIAQTLTDANIDPSPDDLLPGEVQHG